MVTAMREREPELLLSGGWEFTTTDDRDTIIADPEADWADSRMVSVPHSWQEEEDLLEYTGTAWYRREFDLDEVEEDERVVLSFGAVDFETTVWVNGARVGQNEGGYLPFAIDVTAAVEEGENVITLRIHDPADISELPHGKQGSPWYTRVSGPWQDITLVTVPETRVDDVRVTPDLTDDTANIDITAIGTDGDTQARVSIIRNGDEIAETTAKVSGDGAETTLRIPDADYWTPESPVLYDFLVTLERDGRAIDTYEDYFGMREVSSENGTLFLNGEQLTIRGALDQAFYPDTYYRPADLETFEREIRVAKELGFNLLRKHIKPAHPEFIELADRMGILVWEEPANPTRYTDRSKELLREQMYGLIERDFNSPSVIAWSIYNEEWGIGGSEDEQPLWTDSEKQDYLESLYHEVKERDPTRHVCDNSGWAHVATDLNDYHEYFVVPDRVDAWREKLADIVADPEANYGDTRTDLDAPLLISEFGTWGIPDAPALIDASSGDPHWFEHDFLEGMKRPGDVQQKFDTSHISDVFDSLGALSEAWQRREFQSIETIIADMRTHDDIAGYVITELTDIEWEFNGILDYQRQQKSIHDDFARVNAPVMVHLEPTESVAWEGDTVSADLVLTNETPEMVETTVTVDAELPGIDLNAEQTHDVTVAAHDTVRVADAVSFDMPATAEVLTATLSAKALNLDREVSRSVAIAPDRVPADGPTVYSEPEALADTFMEQGYEVVDDPADADVSVVTDSPPADGPTLVVPGTDGHVSEDGIFEYRELAETDSWNLCASFVYQDLLPEIDSVPGWAFDGIYPYGYVTDTQPDDDVSIGYTEGWIENNGAVAMTRDDIGVCTLRVTDTYGTHPIATVVLNRLLAALAE